MKKNLLLLVCLLLVSTINYAQSKAENLVVKAWAEVNDKPATITLKWPFDSKAEYYIINKKTKEAQSWGAALANVPGTLTSFTDNNVEAGKTYEYKIYKFTGVGNPAAYSYIFTGINVPEVENRGSVLVLIDSALSIYDEHLKTLKYDLIGDGWKPVFRFVSRNMKVNEVKNLISQEVKNNPEINTLYLLGRIAVPYSGLINPDAHSDHLGAWPADVYYADLDGTWTDNSVNNSSASRNENKNIPGDGKFDQSILPSAVDLQIGRVDLARMPQFGKDDTVLIRQYLEKNHAFRHGKFDIVERGLIDDNFKGYDEGFSQTGWRNFPAFFGADSVQELDYLTILNNNNYLWSYGCGAGSYTSCSGVGNTSNFATANIKSAFTVLFGSYFGDWDSDNNFLRAPLAAEGQALACFWAGRPHWHVHHMAMGECLGYSTKLSQNNTSLYATGYAAGWVHIALMGDPTLRIHVVEPPKNLRTDSIANVTVKLTWEASDDPGIIGYNIYRASNLHGDFVKINSIPHTSTTYIDNQSEKGKNIYMVRALKLQRSSSGTYYNLSQGIFDSASTLWPVSMDESKLIPVLSIYPNPAKNNLTLFIKNFTENEIQLSIYNSYGQSVYNDVLITEDTTVPVYKNINTSDLPKGIYFVNVSSRSFHLMQKVIIIQ